MAKFGIFSSAGVFKASGTPIFTGTYLKPGVLEFREIASPVPIDFAEGDYVGYYNSNHLVVDTYPRTGKTYRLYQIPQVKKQARDSTYGGAYIYQNVQFKDDSYLAEICQFRDLVVGDNRIHFSTQPAITVFDDVAGIAERLSACLNDLYGANSWSVRLVTAAEGADADQLALMAEEREFSVSGVSILGALEKVYDVWPGVGWVYKYINNKHTIIIGQIRPSYVNHYEYGKGEGLTSLTKSPANAESYANRLYVYGSSRNILSRWYPSHYTIKDGDSVDIQHLMLPVADWGTTGGVKDASKAYLENRTGTENIIARTAYFDGSEDLKEIYPSIKNHTVGDIWNAGGTVDYTPSAQIYSSNQRIDEVLSVLSTFDSGLASGTLGRDYLTSQNIGLEAIEDEVEVQIGTTRKVMNLWTTEWTPTSTGRLVVNVIFSPGAGSTIELDGLQKAVLSVTIRDAENPSRVIARGEGEMPWWAPYSGIYKFGSVTFNAGPVSLENTAYEVVVDLALDYDAPEEHVESLFVHATAANLMFNLSYYRAKTFSIRIPQIGFDIGAQSALGDGKTIAFTSGDCTGRSFKIKECSYIESSDQWELEIWRGEDESLGQYFPCTDYPVAAGDHFVLLDIAMPSLYVGLAEVELKAAALELLMDVSTRQWQYVPEMDAEYMVRYHRLIDAGDPMRLNDSIVDLSSQPSIIDSVTINEGDAAIPTYKVTLRNQKRKSYKDTGGAEQSVLRSLGSSASSGSTGGGGAPDWFVQEDYAAGDDVYQRLRLNPKYMGVWADGFLSAGGLGSGGGTIGVFWGNDQSTQGDNYETLNVGGSARVVALKGHNHPISEIPELDALIPAEATSTNILADRNWVMENAAGTFRGTFNQYSDLHVPTATATEALVAAALANEITSPAPVNNDFCNVEVPHDDQAPTTIERIDRYRFNGTDWVFEYSINNTNFTPAQWAAINSGIRERDVQNIPNARKQLFWDTKISTVKVNGTALTQDSQHAVNVVVPVELGDLSESTTEGGSYHFTTAYKNKVDAVYELYGLFTKEAEGSSYRIKANFPLYSEGYLVAGGIGSGGSGGGGATTLGQLQDVSINSVSAGQALVRGSNGLWINKSLTVSDISDLGTTLTGYVDLDSPQSISGAKTFTSLVKFNAFQSATSGGSVSAHSDILPSSDNARSLGDSLLRWADIRAVAGHIASMHSSSVYAESIYAESGSNSSLALVLDHANKQVRVGGTTSGAYYNLLPNADTACDLGSASKRWNNLYAATLRTQTLYAQSSNDSSLAITLDHTNRQVRIGGASYGTEYNLLPNRSGACNLGSTALKWNKVYASGLYPDTDSGVRLVYDAVLGGFRVYGNFIVTGQLAGGQTA